MKIVDKILGIFFSEPEEEVRELNFGNIALAFSMAKRELDEEARDKDYDWVG